MRRATLMHALGLGAALVLLAGCGTSRATGRRATPGATARGGSWHVVQAGQAAAAATAAATTTVPYGG